jgi:DNA-binding NtrC family response regulator
MTRQTVLIIDDEPGVRFGVRDFLETHGFTVEEASTCEEGQAAFRSVRPDVVILDHSLPDGTAIELLPRLRALDAGTPIVILTAHGTIDLAVRAIQEGADHFLTKPVELTTLLVIVERLVEERRNRQRKLVRTSKEGRGVVDPFVGSSAAIRALADDARRFLASDSPVLIQGETGTGKGVVAAWLHRNGPRAEEAFVDLNCANLSKDLLESELFGHEKGAFTGASAAKVGLLDAAHRGTFFLDEIGDMDPALQPKFLKVLEEKRFRRVGDVRDRQVDIRLIAATHQELPKLVRENRFRSDLYYRISTIPLTMPPLRERKEDLELLASRLLEIVAADQGRSRLTLSTQALHALREYSWPGNIRELRNVLERAVLLCEGDVLNRKDLRFEAQIAGNPAMETHLTLAELETRHIERVLQEEGGRVESAAQRLGIPRSSLYEKIKRLGLSVPKP